MDVLIDYNWFDNTAVLELLRKIQIQQEVQLELQQKIVKNLDQLNTRMVSIETMEKNIQKALDELTILKEREMNRMLREHIPFPFQHPSPVSKLPFRRPFSSKNLDL